MHTIREITRLATMLAGLIAPRLRLDHALASISFEHCRSSRNNPHCAPRHVIYYFIAPFLKIRFSVPAKRDETAIFNPRDETSKVGLQTALSSRFTGSENQILKTVAMKNSIHYAKKNTANATRVNAALALLGQQTSHSFAIAVFRPL